jgi:hypothetical protein
MASCDRGFAEAGVMEVTGMGSLWPKVLSAVGGSLVLALSVWVPRASAAPVALPGPPLDVTAAARPGGAVVSWRPPETDSGSRLSGYLITASPGGKAVSTSAVTSFLVGGLTDRLAYRFSVQARNGDGTGPASGFSAVVRPYRVTQPSPVRAVSAMASFGQVTVHWQPPASDGGGVLVSYVLVVNPGGKSVTVAADADSATLAGLRDGLRYRVSVTAVNAVGTSMAEQSGVVIPEVTVPGTATDVTAAPGTASVTVSWEPPASDGGAAITGYLITASGMSRTIKASPSQRSVTVRGLHRSMDYAWRVTAVNSKGRGSYSDSAPAAPGGRVAAGTVVLSVTSVAALTDVLTNGSLVFDNPPRQVTNLTPGDVVVAGVSPRTPAGLMAKVTAVTRSGWAVTVATVPASLSQALSAADFSANAELTRQDVTNFVARRTGVRLLSARQRPDFAAPGSVDLSVNTILYESSDGRQITINGSIIVNPFMSFNASISCCVQTSSQFTGGVTASASVDINAQVSHDISGGYTLGTLDFGDIGFDVLGVPIVIHPVLTIRLLARGSVTAGFTSGAGETVTLGAQVTSHNADVSAHPIASHRTFFTPPTLYGSFNAAAGAGADLSATVDGVVGISLTDSLWLVKLSVDPARNPWWTLSLENVVDLNLDLSVLDYTLASYHATISDISIELAHATGPYQQITITPSPAAVSPRGSLQLYAHVGGLAAQSVQWHAPPGNGSVTASGLYTAPAEPGVYEVTAAQPASGLSPGAFGLVAIQVGEQPTGPPLNPAAISASFGTASVSWAMPAGASVGNITTYTITAHPGNQKLRTPGDAMSATLSGLIPGGIYTFTITAGSSGGTSIPSEPTSPVVIDNQGAHWAAIEAPLPANASVNPQVRISGMSCPTPSFCTAVGTYLSSSGVQGLLLMWSGGSWTSEEAPSPSNGNNDQLLAVSCPSDGFCVAGGTYAGEIANEGLLLKWSGRRWTADEAPIPENSQSNYTEVTAVSCPSVSYCAAGGDYNPFSQIGMLLTWSGGSWTAIEAPSWTGVTTAVPGVSCPAANDCAAVGNTENSSDEEQDLLLVQNGGGWQAIGAPLPANAAANPVAQLLAISCPSTSHCVAVGGYVSTSHGEEGQVLTLSNGSWTASQAPSPPASATMPGVYLEGVSCPSNAACVMAGTYYDSAGNASDELLTDVDGHSGAIQAPEPPSSQYSGAELWDVSCASSAQCQAAGDYSSPAGQEGMLLVGPG